MRSSIGSNLLDGASPIRQQVGVKGVKPVGNFVFGERSPLGFALATIKKGVDQIVIIVIVSRPSYRYGIPVPGGRGGETFHALLRLLRIVISADDDSCALPRRFEAGRKTCSHLYGDFINHGRDILGAVVQNDTFNFWGLLPAMQHRFPLNKARRWGLDQGSIGRAEVNFFPGTPVAVRVVDIAAACQEFKIALAAHFHASPLREQTRIKNITLVVSFAVKRGA